MKVLDVHIMFSEELPVLWVICDLVQLISGAVSRHSDLETVLVEVHLHEECECLIFVVLHVQLICYQMEVWKPSARNWFESLQAHIVAHFLFISSQEYDVCYLSILFLKSDTWPVQISSLKFVELELWLFIFDKSD